MTSALSLPPLLADTPPLPCLYGAGWSPAPRLASAGNTFTIGGYPYERISLRITSLRGDQLTLPGCIPQGPQASKTYTCNTNFDTGGERASFGIVATPRTASGCSLLARAVLWPL